MSPVNDAANLLSSKINSSAERHRLHTNSFQISKHSTNISIKSSDDHFAASALKPNEYAFENKCIQGIECVSAFLWPLITKASIKAFHKVIWPLNSSSAKTSMELSQCPNFEQCSFLQRFFQRVLCLLEWSLPTFFYYISLFCLKRKLLYVGRDCLVDKVSLEGWICKLTIRKLTTRSTDKFYIDEMEKAWKTHLLHHMMLYLL